MGKLIEKETKALTEKLVVVSQFEEKVSKIDEFCTALNNFNTSLKTIDDWMMGATKELEDIKSSSDKMAPEDRVARTMDLQEDIAAKIEVMKKNAEQELALLPQGEKVPADAQEFKDELARITKYVTDLANRTKEECDKYSEDVKFLAEYRTGIKEFTPWLVEAEKSSTEGLSKPANLAESRSLAEKVHIFDKSCIDHLKVLDAADSAAKKMTTHKEADDEVAALKARYLTVKAVADEWRQKVDTLVRNGSSLITLLLTSMHGLQKIKPQRGRTSSPWRKWNLPLESSKTSSNKRRNWWIISKSFYLFLPLPDNMKIAVAKGMLGLKIACLPIDTKYLN